MFHSSGDWLQDILVLAIIGGVIGAFFGKKSNKDHPLLRTGHTVLMVAASKNNIQEITNLLDNVVVGIDEQNLEGNTALHIAVIHKSFDATKLLLARGANKEVLNKTGQTPLDIAKKSKWGDGQALING
jgi:ankyrin repeat protein